MGHKRRPKGHCSLAAGTVLYLREPGCLCLGAYTTLAYFTAKALVDTLVQIWQPIVFSCIVYPTFNLQHDANKFFIYMAFMILDSMAATALATAVTCIALKVELSTVILSWFFEICRLYGGFFTQAARCPRVCETEVAGCTQLHQVYLYWCVTERTQ